MSAADLEIRVRTDTAAAERGLDGLSSKASKMGGMLKVAGAGGEFEVAVPLALLGLEGTPIRIVVRERGENGK